VQLVVYAAAVRRGNRGGGAHGRSEIVPPVEKCRELGLDPAGVTVERTEIAAEVSVDGLAGRQGSLRSAGPDGCPVTHPPDKTGKRNKSRVGKGRPAGSIELRVSPSPSKIPYGGVSPVRLQMDRPWRPSTGRLHDKSFSE